MPTPTPEPADRPRRGVSWEVGAVVLTGLMLLAAMAYGVFAWHVDRVRTRAEAQLKASGVARTPEALLGSPPPAASNAAPHLEAAYEALHRVAGPRGLALLRTVAAAEVHGAAREVEREAVVLFLDHSIARTASRHLQQALARPACRFDTEYAAGTAMDLPQLEQLRALAAYCALEARHVAVGGSDARRWAALAAGFRVLDALGEEPLTIAQRVRAAAATELLAALRDAAADVAWDEARTRVAIDWLRALDDPRPFARALEGDCLFLHAASFEESSSAEQGVGTLPGAWGRMDRAQHRLALDRLVRTLLTPPHARPHDPVDALAALVPGYCTATRGVLRSVSGLPAVQASLMADARVTGLGLLAMRHADAHGGYPQALVGLGNDPALAVLAVDPFSGQPLRFTREQGGAAVYSVWRNGRDDGGSTALDEHDQPLDWVWRLARVQPTGGTR